MSEQTPSNKTKTILVLNQPATRSWVYWLFNSNNIQWQKVNLLVQGVTPKIESELQRRGVIYFPLNMFTGGGQSVPDEHSKYLVWSYDFFQDLMQTLGKIGTIPGVSQKAAKEVIKIIREVGARHSQWLQPYIAAAKREKEAEG